jgi:hypothetical protein
MEYIYIYISLPPSRWLYFPRLHWSYRQQQQDEVLVSKVAFVMMMIPQHPIIHYIYIYHGIYMEESLVHTSKSMIRLFDVYHLFLCAIYIYIYIYGSFNHSVFFHDV